MSVRPEWLKEAISDLANAPDWRLAEAAAVAVRRYAADGIGFVLRVPVSDGPDEFRLLIPRLRTYVRVRRGASVLYVERVIFR